MKRNPLTIAIGAILIVIFGSLLFTYQVRRSQVAVVLRFGKPVRVDDQPGLGFRLPSPIEKVYTLDERIQNFDTKLDEVKLTDQSDILLGAYVGWRITNAAEFFPKFQNGSIPAAENILEQRVRSAKNDVATQHPLSDFVSVDQRQMSYALIEQQILEDVRTNLARDHDGLEIQFFHIKQIALPESVSERVFNEMTAERQKYIAKITSEGTTAASEIKAEADKKAAFALADAESQALELRGQGEADTVRSLQVLQQNPDLARLLLEVDALEAFLKNNSTILLDPSTPPLNLLHPDAGSAADHPTAHP